VKEQSHKDEMSAALRGDFQRLRERGVPATLVPTATPEPEPPPEAAGAVEVEPVAQAPAPARPPVESEPSLDEVTGGDVPPEPAAETPDIPPADAPAERRGWLARLVGR
jgi:hypothetical protein